MTLAATLRAHAMLRNRIHVLKTEEGKIPTVFREDIRRAVRVLKTAGCVRVFLFGSLAEGQSGDRSDIDLAIQGCPRGEFFHLLGRLLMELDHPVDLVNLDKQVAFAQHLEKEGGLLQVG